MLNWQGSQYRYTHMYMCIHTLLNTHWFLAYQWPLHPSLAHLCMHDVYKLNFIHKREGKCLIIIVIVKVYIDKSWRRLNDICRLSRLVLTRSTPRILLERAVSIYIHTPGHSVPVGTCTSWHFPQQAARKPPLTEGTDIFQFFFSKTTMNRTPHCPIPQL